MTITLSGFLGVQLITRPILLSFRLDKSASAVGCSRLDSRKKSLQIQGSNGRIARMERFEERDLPPKTDPT